MTDSPSVIIWGGKCEYIETMDMGIICRTNENLQVQPDAVKHAVYLHSNMQLYIFSGEAEMNNIVNLFSTGDEIFWNLFI